MSEWINVKDELPDEYVDVIIYYCKDWNAKQTWHVDMGYRSFDDFILTDVGHVSATHWMPLPEPPKEEL
jgi:hypothetical protein